MFGGKYSIFNMLEEYKNNRPLIEAYLKNQTIEGYNDKDDSNVILGMSVAVFLVFLFIGLALYIWAIVLLVRFKNSFKDGWVIPVAILLLFMGAPFFTILLAYLAPKN